VATPSEPAPGEGPRRLHPLSPVLDLSGLGRALLAPGAVALGAGGLRLLALGVVVVLALQVLAWSRRTYQLAGGVLRIEGGVVVRSQQLLPCERIQQVNLVQKLRHRALGVAVLEVEGAGRESGARLAVLERGRAEALRADLLAAKRGAVGPGVGEATGAGAGAGAGGVGGPEAPEWVPTPWPVVTLGYRQLALAGVTGVELLVFLTVITTAVQFGGDRGWPSLDRFDLRLPGALGAVLVVAGVLAAVALWLGMAVAASILSDGGFRLTLVGDELHVQRGLLDRKEASVPLARVQAVRIDASAPRRALGLVSLRIDSAGAGSGEDDRRVRVPILAAGEVDRVLALVAPGSAPLPTLRSPPPVARRRSVVRHAVPVALLAAAPAVLAWPVGALALVAVGPAVAAGRAAYRGLGHALAGDYLVTRSGWLNRRLVAVPLARVQSARSRATPLQRRAGLATLSVDLAGPGLVPQVRDEAAAVVGELRAAAVHPPAASDRPQPVSGHSRTPAVQE